MNNFIGQFFMPIPLVMMGTVIILIALGVIG